MIRAARSWQTLRSFALFASIGVGLVIAGCSSLRVTLAPPPPPLPSGEIERWKEMPRLGPEPDARLPLTLTRTRLRNGLSVTVVPRSESAITSIGLNVPDMRDLTEGPVAVMAEALRAGTRAPSGQTLLNPRLGQRPIDVATGSDGTYFSWDVLPRALEQAFTLLSAFVRTPVFDPAEVDIQRRLALARIGRASESGVLLRSAAIGALPGFERPSLKEDAQNLLKLTPAVLQRIHACTSNPGDAELVVVGPVRAEQVIEQAQRAFGDWLAERGTLEQRCEWPSVSPSEQEGSKPAPLERPELQVAYGSSEPTMSIAIPGPRVDSEDYLPFQLLSDVLTHRNAGSARELRHAGATYSISSHVLSASGPATVLVLSGQLDPKKAEGALQALLREISEMPRNIDADELEQLKRKWRNQVVNLTDSNPALARFVSFELRRKKDASTLPNTPNEIMQLDVARCREVAERYFATAKPSIVFTGARRQYKLNLGIDAHVRQIYWTTH